LHVLPLAVIAVAVCLFGLAIEPLGLVVSLAILIVLVAWAGSQFRVIAAPVIRRKREEALKE